MATSNKGGSSIFWIIGGLIVLAGGVGAYFLLRKPRTDEDTEQVEEEVKVTNEGGDNISVSSPKKYEAPAELDSESKIKKFQDWLDTNKPCWLLDSDGKYKNLSKNAGDCQRNVGGSGYGSYGKNTDNAWKKFGKDYLASLKSTSDKPAVGTASDKDIATIIGYSTGNKSEKKYLQGTNADFVKTWAKAIRDKRSAFVWANQVYRTKTGDKLLEYNPLLFNHYAKIDGKIAKLEASDSADATDVDKGENLGKANGLKYNGNLWLYFPNSGYIYKWYRIDYITKTKPSSNFEGSITDEWEFSAFNNEFDIQL